MKVVAIIQARMGSTRLPGKVLMPLGNTVLLDYVYKRACSILNVDSVVIATSVSATDDPIEVWCAENQYSCFRGDEHDLLKRFLECAQAHNADYVVRITGDCPFFDPQMAEMLIQESVKRKAQYGRIFPSNIPIGLKVSIIEAETLAAISRIAEHPFYREHITLYLDEHLDQFDTWSVTPPQYYLNKNYRLTIDTEKDLELCNTIVREFGTNELVPSFDIVKLLDEKPHLAAINSSVEQKKYKVKK